MSSSLRPGPYTFTQDQVRKVWREGHRILGDSRRSRYETFEYDQNNNLKFATKFCQSLYESVQDPVSHNSRIDEQFSPLLLGRFDAKVPEDDVCLTMTTRLFLRWLLNVSSG